MHGEIKLKDAWCPFEADQVIRWVRGYELIHQLQPQALIGANHHRRPFPGEDFQMFEKDLPGGRTADFNKDSEIGDLPLETCETMNGSWGFNITDRRYKSIRDLIRYLDEEWRGDLRHARRTGGAACLGCDDAERESRVRPRARRA